MSVDAMERRAAAGVAVRQWVSSATYLVFLLFSGSIPAEYSLILPGVGSITRLLGALLMLLVVVDVLGGRSLRPPNLVLWLLAAFAAWSTLSTF
ncbi:MAG: hypothetical protein IPM70_07770 [Proteobacteria bacterium]|nr:hypothetical protein [Pseudomonadota bacterium]